jgi:hypothetical protein
MDCICSLTHTHTLSNTHIPDSCVVVLGDPMLCAFVASLLLKEGCQTLQASSGADALAAFASPGGRKLIGALLIADSIGEFRELPHLRTVCADSSSR